MLLVKDLFCHLIIIISQSIQMQKQGYSIFMFINSSSGGGVGKILVDQQIDRIDFNLDEVVYDVYFFNMRKTRDKGFKQLKQFTNQNKPIIAVICGGDGTVMWVVSELARYGINPKLVNLAIVPLGTGNDFSRNLGWGKEQITLTQNSFQQLKQLIREWSKAEQQYLDLWQIQISVWEYGKFQKVQNAEDKIIEGKTLKKHFCNYFSFGIDGQIGYQFDKRRTSTRIGNLAMYGMMGIKTGLQKVKNLGQLVDIMSIGGNETVFEGNNKGLLDYVSNNPFSFNFGDLMEGVKKINSFHNNQNLLALNINSYMGGVTDIWKKAKENDHIPAKTIPTYPSHSDGKLEFVSFSDSGKIGLQKTFGSLDVGFAEKIIQGEGPFFIKFREYPNQSDHRTFLQVDGQFIKVTHPKLLIIKKSTMFSDSKIRVLHRS